MCNFADKKIKMRHWWGDTTDKVEHSDFTAQELKKKVAVANNDRLHAPVSADCEMAVLVEGGKSTIFMDKDKNLRWNFSFSLSKQMEKKG